MKNAILSAVLCMTASTIAQAQPGGGFGGRGPGPGLGPVRLVLPIVSALDTDGSGDLSSAEIDAASVSLRSLDVDGNGILEAAELLPSPPGGGPPPGIPGVGTLVSQLPVVATLDEDADGSLSAAEISAATDRLRELDTDRDGLIAAAEMLPAPIRPGRPGGGFRGGFGGFSAQRSEPLEPSELSIEDGTASIDSHAVFEQLSYQGRDVLIDTHLVDLEYVKFVITGADTLEPTIYFMNTNTYRAHMMFMATAGLNFGNPRDAGRNGSMLGVLIYRPEFRSPSGREGLFTFEFEPFDVFDYEQIQVAYDELVKYAPIVAGRLAYHPLPAAVSLYEQQQDLYEAARLPVFLDEELYAGVPYLPLNPAESFGILRLMSFDERPGIRDVVLYETLPNEMPHVAGIITASPQTPLSHVNLRAIQDAVPNAYIEKAAENEQIAGLIGKYVYYRVGDDGFELREASTAEVDAHFADLRPASTQTPQRDLSVMRIRPLDELGFADSISVGVKAANVAALGELGFPEGTVPDGFAIPFYFYDEFMKHNGLYADARQMRAADRFESDADTRERALAEFRRRVEDGEMPDWMMDSLADLQRSFPSGTGVRLRSSTNNEDLPGFSGAGLYDSYTHRPEEGHIANSVKQVFASLWNFRAYEEREFYRIDHFAAAMGILAHPNFSDERANGVAVTDDIVFGLDDGTSGRHFYVNVQVGENLVTNPDQASIPEEVLLDARDADGDRIIGISNQSGGELLLDQRYRDELRRYLARIHQAFAELYGIEPGQPFAMEVEFKITVDDRLAIKQARPWVY